MKKVEYSQNVRRKLRNLRHQLTENYGEEASKRIIRQITDAVRDLENFENKGIQVSALYEVVCDYRYIYAQHNYLFYRVETDRVIIVEMFNEKEDFMYNLFGISGRFQESLDYWGE